VELLAVVLKGIWIGGIDWIELNGCEGDPEMAIGWDRGRGTYVRTVLYYCVVCQPAVPVLVSGLVLVMSYVWMVWYV
jgi:hypothetical protein